MLKKRILAALSALIMAVGLLTAAAIPAAAEGYPLPEDTKLYAQAAILVNLTGEAEGDVVLYQKDADEVHAPGSMMRYAVLAYALQRIREENMNIDKVTGKYTQDLFNNYVAGTGVPTANMNFGEKWTLRDLLAVSFMQSASDTVAVLADAIDGSVTAFIEGMNEMAEEIGCEYTHFSNLTGLDSLGQYTTARDMYRIMRYCQGFSEFEEIASRYQVTVKPKSGGERTYVSNNSSFLDKCDELISESRKNILYRLRYYYFSHGGGKRHTNSPCSLKLSGIDRINTASHDLGNICSAVKTEYEYARINVSHINLKQGK